MNASFYIYVRSYNTPGSEDKLNNLFSYVNLQNIYLYFLFKDILYALIESIIERNKKTNISYGASGAKRVVSVSNLFQGLFLGED